MIFGNENIKERGKSGPFGPNRASPPLAFELSLWMWADKLTEGEDNHKALLSDVLAEPNLRLYRSTEGSALVLRGGVVCMGG